MGVSTIHMCVLWPSLKGNSVTGKEATESPRLFPAVGDNRTQRGSLGCDEEHSFECRFILSPRTSFHHKRKNMYECC